MKKLVKKMPDKIIKESFVIIVGKQFGEIFEFLDGKKYVNEFIIAKKMNITVNQARNILYRLSDHGLVSSTRKKDKRKGWYTYFWKTENLKGLEFLRGVILRKIEQLSNQAKSRETKTFYVCERCNIEFSEENALLYEFTCPECGNVFTVKDNSKVLNELNKNVDKLKKRLELVDEEIEKEKSSIEKQREKEIAKEKKEKEKKKAIKKALKKPAKKPVKKKAAKKIIKKTAKKPVKKKAIKKAVKKIVKKMLKKKSSKKKTVKKKK